MVHTSFGQPMPRKVLRSEARWAPSLGEATPLDPPREGPEAAFGSVLDSRASQRAMSGISLGRISALLWHSARTRETLSDGELQHRASPSAGGIHPIWLLVLHPSAPGCQLYDPFRHSLRHLDHVGPSVVANALAEFRDILPDAHGAFLVLAAEHGLTHARYSNANSLVWRDAGCLLATVQLVATWLGVASCPLGSLGESLVCSPAFGDELIPGGVIALGEPKPPHTAHEPERA